MRIAGDRFAISDLRLARIRIHFELTEHPVANDFEVQLAHPGDDRLTGIFMRINAERWVLLRESLQRDCHFFLIQFCLWLDRH